VQLNAAGQVEFELETPWRDGTMHLVMSPLEFMQRLAATATQGRPSGTRAAAARAGFRHRHAALPELRRRGAEEIIAAIVERPVIEKILTHLGLDPRPPPPRAGA